MMNVLVGLGVMATCLLLQVALLTGVMRFYAARQHIVSSPRPGSTARVLIVAMNMLVVGNLAQIAIWAWLFRSVNEFTTFGDAFYHSAVNFASLGYGDIVMSPARRLLGPLEAINGMIMIGVTTSFLLAIVQDAFRKSDVARQRGERSEP